MCCACTYVCLQGVCISVQCFLHSGVFVLHVCVYCQGFKKMCDYIYFFLDGAFIKCCKYGNVMVLTSLLVVS